METLVQLLVNGLGKGAVFALLALGFIVIYKATGVVNLAHGSLVLIGGYVTAITVKDLGFAMAAALGIGVTALAAFLVERALISRAKNADHLSLVLLTMGVDIVVAEDISRRLGSDVPLLQAPWDSRAVHVAGFTFFGTQMTALLVALTIIATFFLAFKFTNWGVAMRAQAENREAAALVGIRSTRVTATAWIIAGLLAGIATLFVVTQDFTGTGLSRSTTIVAMGAIPAAVIGGLESPSGAVVGGFMVGITQALAEVYISTPFAKVAVYVVMLLILLVRPAGLFGTKELTRV